MRKQAIIVRTAFLFGSLLLALLPTPLLAFNYGGGTYGQCQFQTNCPTTPPTNPSTDPPVIVNPPPTVPPSPLYKLTPVGIVDGSVITSSPVTLGATIQVENDTNPSALSNIGWLKFFVESAQVGTAYSPSGDGVYSTNWNAKRYAGSNIAIVAYHVQNGQPLVRADFKVSVKISGATLAPTTAGDEGASAEPQTWLENIVPPEVVKSLKELPPVVVYTFPYWLFVILAILAARTAWHAVREAAAAQRMQKLLARQQSIAEEKDNFIALASHYLHTPLTVMQNGVDMMIAYQEVTENAVADLKKSLDALKLRIGLILENVESNDALKVIQQPATDQPPKPILRSLHFWIPIAIVCVIVLVMNLLLGTVGRWELGVTNMITQFLVFVAVVGFFFVGLRSRNLRRQERAQFEQSVAHQNAIDSARNSFISETAAALHEGLIAVDAERQKLPATPSIKYVKDGHKRLIEILNRFDLLRLIQAGSHAPSEQFELQQIVDKIISDYQPTILTKKLTVSASMQGIQVTGSSQLFAYVLRTVIDNAIKFSNDGGQINIGASRESGKIKITIADNGQGIPDDKLPHLFKPFSRAGSALQFDYEGLGFSLFLDRIIMNYLDGDIDLVSKPAQGTLVTVVA